MSMTVYRSRMTRALGDTPNGPPSNRRPGLPGWSLRRTVQVVRRRSPRELQFNELGLAEALGDAGQVAVVDDLAV